MLTNRSKIYQLTLTTQGPTYPPSEVMDEDGNFIVIGKINRMTQGGQVSSEWGAAIISPKTPVPDFGQQAPYTIVRELSLQNLGADKDLVLCTLPLPLPCNNYPMVFAPDQNPNPENEIRDSFPFHKVPIPDLRYEDGRKLVKAITLEDWVKAKGECRVTIDNEMHNATFQFNFTGLIPDSLYTIMALREHDLNPDKITRPGPLGVPNVFISEQDGSAHYRATLPNPFPSVNHPERNRIINVIVLWMSSQSNYGGAIAQHGLGGDIHAQLKLSEPSFFEFTTDV